MQANRLETIRAQIRKLEEEAERIERASKPGIAQLQTIISKYQLTAQDVQRALSLSGVRRNRGVPKGTHLEPKYRNPNNPKETWAGRGLKPGWMLALLRQGKKMADLSIRGSTSHINGARH